MLRKSCLFIMLLLIGCGSQISTEKKMKLNWDIDYVQLNGEMSLPEMVAIPINSAQLKSAVLVKDKKLSPLFENAVYEKRESLWKGGSLAIVKLKNGQEIKIAISNYGGYFKILGQGGYYYFKQKEDRELWESLFFGDGSRI
jgi:hypothetical protein